MLLKPKNSAEDVCYPNPAYYDAILSGDVVNQTYWDDSTSGLAYEMQFRKFLCEEVDDSWGSKGSLDVSLKSSGAKFLLTLSEPKKLGAYLGVDVYSWYEVEALEVQPFRMTACSMEVPALTSLILYKTACWTSNEEDFVAAWKILDKCLAVQDLDTNPFVNEFKGIVSFGVAEDDLPLLCALIDCRPNTEPEASGVGATLMNRLPSLWIVILSIVAAQTCLEVVSSVANFVECDSEGKCLLERTAVHSDFGLCFKLFGYASEVISVEVEGSLTYPETHVYDTHSLLLNTATHHSCASCAKIVGLE